MACINNFPEQFFTFVNIIVRTIEGLVWKPRSLAGFKYNIFCHCASIDGNFKVYGYLMFVYK